MTIKYMGLSLVLALLLLGSPGVYAADYATIIKSENMAQFQQGRIISVGQKIVTLQNQRVAFRNADGDVVVLGENSSISIRKPNLVKQLFGKIYYLFKPRTENKTEVVIVTATIGIRGTRFLVTSTESENTDLISLETGLLNVASSDDQPFKVHNLKPQTEFEKFLQETEQGVEEIKDEFAAYKKQVDEEFIEYKQSVRMTAGKTLKIVGKDLYSVDLPAGQQDEIDTFKAFIADVTQ